VLGYAQGMTVKAAARYAGYPLAKAVELFQRDDIAETVYTLRQKIEESLGDVITRDFVGEMILAAHKKAVSATEELAAARDLAKLYGLNAPEKTVQVVHHLQRIEQLEGLSDSELARLAAIDEGLLAPPVRIIPDEEIDDGQPAQADQGVSGPEPAGDYLDEPDQGAG